MTKTLTPKQARFVMEYPIDLCGKQAAIRAGYAAKTARQRAYMLLRKPHVRAAIEANKQALAKAAGITAERVLGEIALVAFSDVQDYVERDKRGLKTKEFRDMPDGKSRALESITESRGPNGDRVTVKVHDKMKALDKLCAHLGICREKLDVDAKVDTELTIKVVKV